MTGSRVRGAIRWLAPIRRGLHPRSALALRRGECREGRFRGRQFRGPDPALLAHLVLTVWGGEYERPGFLPGRGESVVDVGANIGLYSLLAAARGANVEAFEPHPETFSYLHENAGPWSIQCHQAAVVGASRGDHAVELWLHPSRNTQHGVLPIDLFEDGERTGRLSVPAVSLGDVIADGCDLLKLDCEGAEFELLLDTPVERLQNARRIVAELHERAGETGAVVERLRALGFEVALERIPGAPLALLFARRHA